MQYLVEMKLAAYSRPSGGPQDGISFIEQYIASLPIWPQMETTVTPLTSFSGRMVTIRPRLERLKAKLQNGPSAAI